MSDEREWVRDGLGPRRPATLWVARSRALQETVDRNREDLVATTNTGNGASPRENEPPTAEEQSLLLSLYAIERQHDQTVLNAQLAIIGLLITYVTASLAVVATDFLPGWAGEHWSFALLPILPTLLFCYLVLFLSDALLRREYMNSIEGSIRLAGTWVKTDWEVQKDTKYSVIVPSWGEISKNVWEPKPALRNWPLMLLQLCLFACPPLLLVTLIGVAISRLPGVWMPGVVLVLYAVPVVAIVRAGVNMLQVGGKLPINLHERDDMARLSTAPTGVR